MPSREPAPYPARPVPALLVLEVCRLLFLEAEAHLQADLEMPDLAILHVSADLGDLEPVQVAQRFVRPPDGVADRIVDALCGGADDLSDSVRVIAHASLWRRSHHPANALRASSEHTHDRSRRP